MTTKNYGMNLSVKNITTLKHMAVDNHTSLNKLVDTIIEEWILKNTNTDKPTKPIQINHFYGI